MSVSGRTRLGDRAKSIRRRYGKPRREQARGDVRTIEYQADDSSIPDICVYEGSFAFKRDRLVYVSIYSGE